VEKLLYQGFFVSPEGFELLCFGVKQGVEAGESQVDALFFLKS
jgi:hypothetical protein